MRALRVSVPHSSPDIGDWTLKVRSASDEELITLRSTEYLGMRNLPDQRWKLLVVIAEEELRHRIDRKAAPKG